MSEHARVAGIEVDLDHFIGGERVASAGERNGRPPGGHGRGDGATSPRFSDLSPIDETVLCEVARGGAPEAAAAVSAAAEAFSTWGATSPATRARILHRVADGIEARLEDFARLETEDNGALLRSHRRGVMPRVVHNFRFFADFLTGLGHEDFETRGHSNHVSWEPAGVAVLITPWNAPLMLATWKIAPALAAGDTVVVKPAEWSPLTASLLCDVASEAGLPPGVLNLVQGFGEEAGRALVGDGRVARVGFTGSVGTAREIGRAAGANLTPVSFELGGKSPFLVFADADLDLAVDLALEQFDNAGQVCLAGTRMLVAQSLAGEFTERFAKRAGELRQGDPRDSGTDVGPLISRPHFDRVNGFVTRALAGGAEAVFGGGPNDELGGLYYRPTLLTGAAQGSEILSEEVFGPVVTLQTFADEEEAVELANSTELGLAAVVVTSTEETAARVASRLVAGTVWVNCFFVRDLRAPFGGARHSGIGREGGEWSFDFYCELKNTVTAPDRFSGGAAPAAAAAPEPGRLSGGSSPGSSQRGIDGTA